MYIQHVDNNLKKDNTVSIRCKVMKVDVEGKSQKILVFQSCPQEVDCSHSEAELKLLITKRWNSEYKARFDTHYGIFNLHFRRC